MHGRKRILFKQNITFIPETHWFLFILYRPCHGFRRHLDECRQKCEKLRCLYENLMSNNFRKTTVLLKKKIYKTLISHAFTQLVKMASKPWQGVFDIPRIKTLKALWVGIFISFMVQPCFFRKSGNEDKETFFLLTVTLHIFFVHFSSVSTFTSFSFLFP